MKGYIRELSTHELSRLYLPLRMRVLHNELNWVRHDVTGAESFRDSFDADAIHFGFFTETDFAGAIRLILRDSTGALPSGPFMPLDQSFPGRVAEISKGLVETRFRGHRIFSRLLQACIQRSITEGVQHLFVSADDTPRARRIYAHYGFTPVACGFHFSDQHIAPGDDAILFHTQPAT